MAHCLLFTGHMIDRATRSVARFPAHREKAVTAAILRAAAAIKKDQPSGLKAIAGGACGGDILFHEACCTLDIPLVIYLAAEAAAFCEASVSFAGSGWDKRFERLRQQRPTLQLPPSLSGKHADIWEAANDWMMQNALAGGGSNMTLLALWDGKDGDGRGGTAHMVRRAQQEHARVIILDMKQLTL